MRVAGTGRILLGVSLTSGLLAALLVFFPRVREDSRMVLEAVLANPAEPGSEPQFTLRYDRGRGFHGLRVVEPQDVRVGETDRYRWVFDDRPIRSLRIEARGWAGDFAVKEAVLEDVRGRVLHRFDVSGARFDEPKSLGPEHGEYHAVELRIQGEGVPGLFRISGEGFRVVLAAFFLGAVVSWFVLQLARPRCADAPLERFRLPYGQGGDPAEGVVLPALLLLGAVVLIRSWSNFLHPSLFVEDAFHYFNRYYGARVSLADALLFNPNGYLNVLPNLFAWLLGHVDPQWVPGAYVGIATSASLLAAVLPAKTGLIQTRSILFATPLVLGLSGLNHVFYFTTLTFHMYVVVLILLGILLLPEPESRSGLVGRVAIGVLLVFSGPYSVVAVPATVLLLLLFRSSLQSWFWASVAIAGVLFMATTDSVASLGNLVRPAVLGRMADVLVQRVLLLDLVPLGAGLGAALVGISVGGIFFLLRSDERFLRFGLVLLSISLLSLAPLFLSLKFFKYPDPYACHILIAQFFWLFFLLFAADRVALRWGKGRFRSSVLATLFIAFVIFDNVRHPSKRFFPPNPHVAEFVREVSEWEDRELGERNEFVVVEAKGAMQEAFLPQVRVGSMRSDAVEIPVDRRHLEEESP